MRESGEVGKWGLTAIFPASERYGLVRQARRAAFSVAANIVEGHAKKGRGEFRRFLDIALGSLAELTYVLVLARDLGYAPAADLEAIQERCAETGKILWGLYRSVSEGRAR